MGDSAIQYSIIVCLHDSLDYLEEQLGRIAAQEFDLSRAEVVVVDNGSREEIGRRIRETVEGCEGLNVRCISEPRLGAQYARNAGLAESVGDLAIYLDDDALPLAGWLAALDRCRAEHPGRVVQGRIVLRYDRARPEWMTPHLEMLLSKMDLGEEDLEMGPGNLVLANSAFPRRLLDEYGDFDTRIGRKGDILLSGEDWELLSRVARGASRRARYCAGAAAEHVVRDNRYEKSFFLLRAYWGGITGGYLLKAYDYGQPRFSALVNQLRIGLGCLVLWPLAWLVRDRRAFTYKCRFVGFVGFLRGLLFFKGLPSSGD